MRRAKGRHTVKVGLPKGVMDYPDGTKVAMVGLWNEFGTHHSWGTIPERSWMRSSIRDNRSKYMRLNRHHLLQIQRDAMRWKTALGRLGELASKDMVKQIENFTTPANAPSTIAAKARKSTGSGHPGPLEDTGHMKQVVTYEVM